MNNRDPFRILACLMEESGELADQVHLREAVGRKRENDRPPDDLELAKEIRDIMTAVLDIARYYGIEEQLEQRVTQSCRRTVNEGLIEPLPEESTPEGSEA